MPQFIYIFLLFANESGHFMYFSLVSTILRCLSIDCDGMTLQEERDSLPGLDVLSSVSCNAQALLRTVLLQCMVARCPVTSTKTVLWTNLYIVLPVRHCPMNNVLNILEGEFTASYTLLLRLEYTTLYINFLISKLL